MLRNGLTKLAPPKTRPEDPILTLEESNQPEHKEEPALMELDNEMEYPRCKDVMELSSNFDALAYYCVRIVFCVQMCLD